MSVIPIEQLQRIMAMQQKQNTHANIPTNLLHQTGRTPITQPIQEEKPLEKVKPITKSKKQTPTDDENKEIQFIAKKKAIPKHVKTLVWNKYIGADKAKAPCMSCRQADIGIRSFHCGHVVAEAKGGDMTINNLRPICSDCNLAMGTMSMNEFTSQFFGWQI